ncbi:2-keto-4-pentenoate hydratase [Acinetobacter marinus]|uniref:2-keto-4-pentenoate hydratase n=1 Tax=Acinetobacter marinus TaxID=281375 RepID=A0A1G6GLV6_9GAMM|nr:fumarylacetoacetate hydrolase family protein [Acinetobacter marinus]SDB82156.1 2-keto-4-pentenoate hydratase [Acinetobacter marinus]
MNQNVQQPANERIRDAAKALREARQQRKTIEKVSITHGIQGLDEAYSVAQINTDAKRAQGHRIIGKKVGLTSKAVQLQLGVDQPDFGILFEDMMVLEGDRVQVSQLIQPKAEAEVAFVLSKDIENVVPTWTEFLTKIAYALPALEIVDSAIHDWKIILEDTVADNASCGLVVLGQQPIAIDQFDFSKLDMHLEKNGEMVSIGTGSACLGHPLRAAWWLAKTMVERGIPLKAGEVILSGALGPMVNVQKGDVLHVNLGKLGAFGCVME